MCTTLNPGGVVVYFLVVVLCHASLYPSRQDATAGLTWCFFPGDDLTIYGVVMQRWKPFQQDVRCEVEIVLKANYVQVNNEQSTGINMDEEVRKEFEDFWEYYKSDPFAGLCLRVTRLIITNGISLSS